MSTTCYAPVRGSALRLTELDLRGGIPVPHIPGFGEGGFGEGGFGGSAGYGFGDGGFGAGAFGEGAAAGPSVQIVTYGVSRSVSKVTITEVNESGSNELLRSPENVPRLRLTRPTETIRFKTDIDFIRIDPSLLSLVTKVPVVVNAAGDIVGFDANTRLPAAAFAMEVWTKLAGNPCADGASQWGYTVLPFLKGGILSGFRVANGLISFSLKGAQTRRAGDWGQGPYGPMGSGSGVSRNTAIRQFITTVQPPEETDGTVTISPDIPEPESRPYGSGIYGSGTYGG